MLYSMNYNVIVTGTLGFDYIMNFQGDFTSRIMPDKIHAISLSFLVDELNKNFGGTAGNIAYTLKILGIEPILVSIAGNDFSPYKKFLKSHNISTKNIRIVQDKMTGSYFVVTDQNNNQIGSFYKGATQYANELSVKTVFLGLNQNSLNNNSSLYGEGAVNFAIIAPTDVDAMNKYVLECQELNIPYLFDPAFQIGDFSKQDLFLAIKKAAILIGNDYEIALIKEKLAMTHRELCDAVPILITTLGNKGSLIESVKGKAESLKIGVARLDNESDPTGAGDAYRAGFIVGYLRGFDLQTCGQMGSVAAAYTVEKHGTLTHEFTKKSFKKRYQDNFKEEILL